MRGRKKLGIRGEAVGLHDLDDLRMGAGGDVSLRALAVLAHGDRLGRGGRAVVVRGVGDVHAGQLADHRLEFKRALQNALADLRLIGSVAGDKLFAGGDGFDDRRDEVAVGARAGQINGVKLVGDYPFLRVGANSLLSRDHLFHISSLILLQTPCRRSAVYRVRPGSSAHTLFLVPDVLQTPEVRINESDGCERRRLIPVRTDAERNHFSAGVCGCQKFRIFKEIAILD